MKYFGLTDVGKVRQQNQDYFLCSHSEEENWALLIVCDGMGGAKSGNIASELACRVFSERFIELFCADMDAQNVGATMLRALEKANSAVYEMSLTDYDCRGMGTTMVAAFINSDACVILNVGDSRAYILSDSGVHMVTHDHSYVQRLIDAGELTPEEAKYHSNRNVITRAVGTMPTVRGDLYNPALAPGMRLLMCTDGLSNLVTEDEFLPLSAEKDLADTCRALINTCLERGASDNATVVIYEK